MATVLDVAAETQTGHVRSGNEDSFITGQHVWVVADGMGGPAEEAAEAGDTDQSGASSIK